MKISCHCLVKNEENFIYYAIISVIDYVDEILVWDTGSSDKTVEIVKSINNPKIKFKEIGKQSAHGVSLARQQMLDETKADWIFILDGDEIWHKHMIGQQTKHLKESGDKFDVVVSPNTMLVGDMYHCLDESFGQYKIHGKKGHLNIRFIKNLPELHIRGTYPSETYVDGNKVPVQNLPKERVSFSDYYYLHASFLPRSSKDRKKVKYELTNALPLDYYYPESFFINSSFVGNFNLWRPFGFDYTLKSMIVYPFKKFRRMFK
ncbi:MAG: glycosyltransferase [Patescibacteria group bacterium]